MMTIQQAKTILLSCLLVLTFSLCSYGQQQGAKSEMIITHSVNKSNPIRDAIIAKYGNDEAKIGEAKQKVRKWKAAGKRVMTSQEFAEWKQAVDTKMKGLQSNADKQKMRELITKKIATIIILEDNI